MLNKVMLMGRLGKDPEIKYLASGAAIATFNIVTDESWIDRNGQRVDHAEWHRIITFQRLAENCAHHIGKGSLVYVEGSLQTRKWIDQNGQNRYVTEVKAQKVLFLDRRRPDNQQNSMDSEWQPRRQDRNDYSSQMPSDNPYQDNRVQGSDMNLGLGEVEEASF